MSKVTLLEPGKIGSLIELVKATGEKYQSVLHEAAVQCLAHAAKHGDRSLLARLIGGNIKNKKGEIVEKHPGVISKATSARELKLWVQYHSPLRWDRQGAIVVSKEAVKKGVGYDIEAANAEPFWDLQVNQDERNRPINMDNIQNVVFGARRRFENALAAGKFTGDPVAMRKYLDTIEAVQMPKVDKRRMVEADFKAHDEVEVKVMQGEKVKREEAPTPEPVQERNVA